MRGRWYVRGTFAAVLLCSWVGVQGEVASAPPGCLPTRRHMNGLQASLTAERGWGEDKTLESVTFCLANRSKAILLSKPETWALVVDGKVAPDPGGMLWIAGGRPPEGYGTVPPSGTIRFGKGLSRAQYFPADRDYRLFWKAAGFRSNVVVIRGGVK